MDPAPFDKRAVLSRHPFFDDAPASLVERLATHARIVTFPSRRKIFRKGEEGLGLFAVLSGVVKISVPSPDGKELVLRLVGASEIFGEVALLDGGPRTADATASTRCQLLYLDRRDFVSVLKDEPSLAIKLLALVSDRLRQTSEQVEDLTFAPPATRLARALLRVAQVQGAAPAPNARIRISQKELGETVGLSRETTNKCLREWAVKGHLALERGACILLNPAFFSALAHRESSQ